MVVGPLRPSCFYRYYHVVALLLALLLQLLLSRDGWAQQAYIDSLRDAYETAEPTQRIDIAQKLVEVARFVGPELRIEYGSKGAAEARELGDSVSWVALQSWQAYALHQQGDTAEAMALLDAAFAIDSSLPRATGIPWMLKAYSRPSQEATTGVVADFKAGLAIATANQQHESHAAIVAAFIRHLIRTRQLDSVIVLAQREVPLLVAARQWNGAMALSVIRAEAYRNLSMIDSALYYYQLGFSLLDSSREAGISESSLMVSGLYENYSRLLHSTGNPLAAMELRFQGIEYVRSRPELPNSVVYVPRVNLALQYIEVGDKKRGHAMLRELGSEPLTEITLRGGMFAINYLFEHFEQQQKSDSAARYLELARVQLGLHPDHDPHSAALFISMLGGIQCLRDSVEQGVETRKKAIRMMQQHGRGNATLWMHITVARGYKELNRLDSALQYAERAFDMAVEEGNHVHGAEAALLKASILAAMGRFQEAYYASELARTLEDSTRQESQAAEMNYLRLQKQQAENKALARAAEANNALALQKSAEASEAQQQLLTAIIGFTMLLLVAALLWRSRQRQVALRIQVSEQRDELAEANAEKAVLLKEVHHRVKNNLQVLSSLLSMQGRQLTDPAALAAVQEGQSRVKSIALIHQKLYQHDHLDCVDFQGYTEQLVEAIADTFEYGQNIRKDIQAKGVTLDIDTAIPIGLILNELVSNAYKYAFADADSGTLTVELQPAQSGGYVLRVADSGSGLPEGFNLLAGSSLGMKIVDGLARQLRGSVDCWNDGGAVFLVQFHPKAAG